ncbi:MAG: hypothetical protein AAGC95_12115 [Pseudomonadota bacterium]
MIFPVKFGPLKAAAAASALFAGVAAAQTPVAVETLGGADTFSLGLLSQEQGALPPTLWRGGEARVVAYLLERAPARGESPALADLLRRTLLTPGAAPAGAGPELMGAKLEALVRAGFGAEARALVNLNAGLAGEAPAARALASADLLDGDQRTACLRGADLGAGLEEAYWLSLRAFCYAAAGEPAAAELTLGLLRERGAPDPVADALLSGLILNADPGLQLIETPLHYAIAKTAGMELSDLTLARADAGVLAALAKDQTADLDLRLFAAFRAYGMRALSSSDLDSLLQSVPFETSDVAALLSTKSVDGTLRGFAAAHQALASLPNTLAPLTPPAAEGGDAAPLAMAPVDLDAQIAGQADKAALLAATLAAARDPMVFLSLAELNAAGVKALIVDETLADHGVIFARALMAAGDAEKAARWLSFTGGDARARLDARILLYALDPVLSASLGDNANDLYAERLANMRDGAAEGADFGLSIAEKTALSVFSGAGALLDDEEATFANLPTPPFALRAIADSAVSGGRLGEAALGAIAMSNAAYDAISLLNRAGIEAEARRVAFDYIGAAQMMAAAVGE